MAKRHITSDQGLTHEEIASLAYSIFEKSGRIPGRDMENWLQAEAQLLEERRTPAQPSLPPRNGGKQVSRPVLTH